MDFFEVLIILAFVFLPLLEGIFKRRRAGQGGDAPVETPPARERERVGQGAGATSAGGRSGSGGAPREPVDAGPAADMIPADLWEVLTGERRSPAPSGEPSWEVEEEEEEEEPWARTPVEEAPDELGIPEHEPSPWGRASEDPGEWVSQVPEPVSSPHGFPEIVSLETPPAPPEVRHRRFHEKYDSEPLPPTPDRGDFVRDLRSGLRGQGLRRSVILAEVLGPPKGLA